jgi:CheY-like chemotaxis protein
MRDILVVDDDRELVEVIRAVLEHDGYSCRTAGDGRQALAMSAEAKPALVLLDLRMPVMNGWECARALRAQHGRSLPIFIIAAEPQHATRRNPLDADGMLGKPFALSQLLQVARHYASPSS